MLTKPFKRSNSKYFKSILQQKRFWFFSSNSQLLVLRYLYRIKIKPTNKTKKVKRTHNGERESDTNREKEREIERERIWSKNVAEFLCMRVFVSEWCERSCVYKCVCVCVSGLPRLQTSTQRVAFTQTTYETRVSS